MEGGGGEIVLPVDIVVADRFAADAETRVVPADAIPDGWMGLDIGPRTAAAYAASAPPGADDFLERPDGRLRDGAVRGRHAGGGERDRRLAAA